MKATFAAGCFWGVEAAFRQVEGVIGVTSGYTGGTTEYPTYEEVCKGGTGHAEAVLITYDPSHVTFEELLRVFWSIHRPTNGVKDQYRSVVFYHSEEQRQLAESLNPGGTEITRAARFYPAEEYHQRYYEK